MTPRIAKGNDLTLDGLDSQVTGLPRDARFVFTILDDTDEGTVDNLRPIYALLAELGLRTTKTVWPLDCPPELQGSFGAGQTLRDPEYLDFVRELVSQGFEIAFHNASMGSSPRIRTLEGLQVLRQELGEVPILHCNHAQNRENLYWGSKRYRSALGRIIACAAHFFLGNFRYEGEVTDSPYFWGDACREHFRFVRSFAFETVDIRRIPPGRPYRDSTTPWVNFWFSTGDAPDADHFCALLTTEAIERVVRTGGVCIISTHLGKGFVRDGQVEPRVEKILRDIAGQGGWFAPVSEVLEYLLSQVQDHGITRRQRVALEMRHIADRVKQRLGRRSQS